MTRVMLVDDHRIVREGLAYMLTEVDGVELVGEAGSAAEMFDMVDRMGPDIILLDVHMPEMSGLEALERLLRDHPDLKVIMLSMHDQAAYVQQAIRLGAAGYLLKSAGLEELVRALQTVSEGRPYLQGELAGALVEMTDVADSPSLTTRELEVLRLLTAGSENKQIARQLGISEATVKTHLKSIYERLEVRSRAEAAARAVRLGLVD